MQLSKRGLIQGAAMLGAPMIVPSTVFGRNAPSNRINVGAIGVGRISRGHDIAETIKHHDVQVMAVCDVDTRRLAAGVQLVDAHYAEATGRKLQIGSQQRGQEPWPQFHRAAELVRNDRIGALRHVEVGLPGDPSGPEAPPMPIPPSLDHDAWLGTTPEAYYTEMRVHPQDSFDGRPGWLRCEQFGSGMITGWGSHHIDIAHWGMDMERSGPVEVWGAAEFPASGLWDVHGPFETHARYANGVTMTISGALPNGVRFIGDQGWIFLTRSGSVTASDPGGPQIDPLQASDASILTSTIGADEIHLLKAPEQHRNWLDAIRTGEPLSAPAEIGH